MLLSAPKARLITFSKTFISTVNSWQILYKKNNNKGSSVATYEENKVTEFHGRGEVKGQWIVIKFFS